MSPGQKSAIASTVDALEASASYATRAAVDAARRRIEGGHTRPVDGAHFVVGTFRDLRRLVGSDLRAKQYACERLANTSMPNGLRYAAMDALYGNSEGQSE